MLVSCGQTDDELLHDISSVIAQSGEQLFTDLQI